MATNKSVKDKIKAKAKQTKDKVKQKLKGGKKAAKVLPFAVALALIAAGCATSTPASRATTAQYGDIEISLKDKCSHNTVRISLGDGALASADSAGSTETQTSTPTFSLPIQIDARYNDALAAASTASKGVLSSLGSGLGAVLDMMVSGKSGTVSATKTDGTPVTVLCENGQCSFCEDCEVK